MQHYNFVIFGEEPEYALHLKTALLSGSYPGYSVYLFRKLSAFTKFLEEEKADILLISESTDKDVRSSMPAEKKFVITTKKNVKLNEDEKEVYKYQGADAIIYSAIRSGDTNNVKEIYSENKRLIGVYSPVKRIGNTKYALELGKKLSDDETVLYINMEGYSGLDYYFTENEDGDVSDLIYYIHQENCDIGKVINQIVTSCGTLNCINPSGIAADLRSVKEKDWITLFERIFEETAYTTIILDLGDMIDGLEKILLHCEIVYTRYLPDNISRSKIKQYTDNLRATGFTEVIEHTVLEEVEFGEGE